VNCCGGPGCDEFFTERVARRDARRYRRRGLDANARRIVDLVRDRGTDGKSVLEVGGGIGAIQLELLAVGAARTTNVELSPAYEETARELLRERGLAPRVERRLLDFAKHADEVEPADIVVLHRVVCCYPDYQTLVDAAAMHARDQLLLSFPRDAWWMRLGVATTNLIQRLRGRSFRAYVHAPDAIVGAATAAGLETSVRERGRLWELTAFARA
jgi:magnesium-protoporphyrin O-methyltransferase